MENTILTHRRSRKRILTTNAISVVVMLPFLYWLASAFEFRGEPLWICIGLLVLNLAMSGYSSWKVWNQPHDFWCTLSADRISCHCPVKIMGATFDLSLEQIREIREESTTGGGPKYVLVSVDGAEYWLTTNFGNPAWRFVNEVRTRFSQLNFIQT